MKTCPLVISAGISLRILYRRCGGLSYRLPSLATTLSSDCSKGRHLNQNNFRRGNYYAQTSVEVLRAGEHCRNRSSFAKATVCNWDYFDTTCKLGMFALSTSQIVSILSVFQPWTCLRSFWFENCWRFENKRKRFLISLISKILSVLSYMNYDDLSMLEI